MQILHICGKFSSCFLEMISCSGLPLFCDKVQAGETLYSVDFLFGAKHTCDTSRIILETPGNEP